MPENSNLPLKIAVCDDEPADCRQITGLTNAILAAEGLSCSVSGYESVPFCSSSVLSSRNFMSIFSTSMGILRRVFRDE